MRDTSQEDLALLDVIGPYPASVHSYDVQTRAWKAVHASVSIEKTPFHGDAKSEFQVYKIYQADDRGHIKISVGKEKRLLSQTSCHEQVLRQRCVEQCIEELVRRAANDRQNMFLPHWPQRWSNCFDALQPVPNFLNCGRCAEFRSRAVRRRQGCRHED
jgi:hypothetical protein